MRQRRYRPELGQLVEVRYPGGGPVQSWVILTVVSLLFTALFLDTEWWFMVGTFVFMFVCVAYVSPEFFLQQRYYEHGLVLYSRPLPGTSAYVVPYFTIDPDSVEAAGSDLVHADRPHTHRSQTSQIARGRVWLTGPNPFVAGDLLRHPDRGWHDVYTSPPYAVHWVIAAEDPDETRDLLARLVRASQASGRPYLPPEQDDPRTG